jgi:ChrR Cupin-like domain
MAKPELEFHEPSAPWRPTGNAGTEERVFAEDPENGTVTRLLRFEPGADTSAAGTLTHEYWEEIYVISGDLTDLRLGERFESGQYACRPPGMEHGPWTSENGALLFEVRYFSR